MPAALSGTFPESLLFTPALPSGYSSQKKMLLLLLLLLSRFSRVRLCVTPGMAELGGLPSMARTLEWVAISFSNA